MLLWRWRENSKYLHKESKPDHPVNTQFHIVLVRILGEIFKYCSFKKGSSPIFGYLKINKYFILLITLRSKLHIFSFVKQILFSDFLVVKILFAFNYGATLHLGLNGIYIYKKYSAVMKDSRLENVRLGSSELV
jgi:hypothetical protein